MYKALAALTLTAAATGLAFAPATATAAVVPLGVVNDVGYSTVTGTWGWQLVSRSSYDSTLSLASLFSGLSPDSLVMLGAMRSNSRSVDVLAAAKLSDITTYTSTNYTHVANGAEWYFNGYSMGFAGLGDLIDQATADNAGVGERDRLSWNTSGTNDTDTRNSAMAGMSLVAGSRSGSNLGAFVGWDRLVFVLPGANLDVPEPSSLALLAAAGLAAFSVRRRAKVS